MEHRDTPLTPHNTTDAFTDVAPVIDARGAYGSVLVLGNTGANSLTYQVLGSINQADWGVLDGPTAIAAGAQHSVSIAAPWPWLKVQARSTGAGLAGTLAGSASSLI